MTSSDFPRGAKDSWTERQWEIYRHSPWIVRRLADVAVLIPGLPDWLGRQSVQPDESKPSLKAPMEITQASEIRPPRSA